MDSLEKHSLEHVHEVLKSYENHAIFSAVHDAVTGLRLADPDRKHVTDCLKKALSVEYDKVQQARHWVKVLLDSKRT